jgi:hypothetical protein
MEESEGGRWEPDPRGQEPLVQRRPSRNHPMKLDVERTADEQSTVRNGGLGSGGSDRGPIMPAGDSTLKLNTKI